MSITYNTSVVKNGLVLYLDAANVKSYPGSGTTWTDLSTNRVIGSLVNGPVYDASNKGSITFDGGNDLANFGTSFTALDQSDKTFQCWIKKSSSSNSGIVDKDYDSTSTGGSYGGWGFWVQSTGKLWYWNHANKDIKDTGPLSITYNTWNNVAMTYSASSKTATFYINAQLNSAVTDASVVENASGTAPLVVGAIRNGFAGFYYNGGVSVVKGYNRILSAAEIKQNFEATRGRYRV